MKNRKKIKTALISVYHKDKLDELVKKIDSLGISIYSTGGTQKFIETLDINVNPVEELTSYPSILGGRVKTLHPKVFGGILARRDLDSDNEQLKEYDIPGFDLVIVDLYPFEKTVSEGASEDEVIEKIDIGGISLIRAAAKNYKDVIIVPSRDKYEDFLSLLNEKSGETDLSDRKDYALHAFNVSSHYDTAIFKYFNQNKTDVFKESIIDSRELRYGENPHQKGIFFGQFDDIFKKLHGKEISYNNLLDIDAAVGLISEFDETTFAILKHNNACGIASRENLTDSWKDALAGDPVSAFGGVLITNTNVDKTTAEEIHKIFFEVIIAPAYSDDALSILKQKKNRIILISKEFNYPDKQYRSLLTGFLCQDRDKSVQYEKDLKVVTNREPSNDEISDLLFANKIVKHTKSNAIVLIKDKQLCGSGVGQTSRVDALKQAIEKARTFNLSLEGASMASDAFFPFPDCVEIANSAGIKACIQPGGSIRDKDSISYCDNNQMTMVLTGIRHFKH
ncbi:bifunctional phosphoribosylaminoimidazolecarboxamide formyltransferase/IMP cyclohydrolase [Bacteroidota bacterium]